MSGTLFLTPVMPGMQDIFVSKVTRSKETIQRKSAKKTRGWYTQERMRTKLGWSKPLDSITHCMQHRSPTRVVFIKCNFKKWPE